MNPFPNAKAIEITKKRFPTGTRVELISMDDPFTKLVSGDKGTVTYVDDIGTVFVNWDNGSCLGVALGQDYIRKI